MAPETTLVQVIELSRGKADVLRFLEFAYAIYGEDPHWVAPLLMDQQKVFRPSNPFFEHAEMQLWMAVRDGRDVGRIAGIIDRTHNEYHHERSGFFGFFESIDDPAVARGLMETVAGWARARGMDRLLGPMNPSTNDECGTLIEGFDSPPVLMMTYNPRYYLPLLEGCGCRKARDLIAFYIDLAHRPMERLGRIAEKVRKRNPELQFRPILKRTLRNDLDKVKQVYNAAWSDNWGFVPMTEAEVDFMASRLKPLFTEGLVWLAEVGPEPVGFLLAIADFNHTFKPLKGRLLTPRVVTALPSLLGWTSPPQCRVITLGVKSGFRGRGLESVMLYEGLKTGERLKLKGAEASWILEDNLPMRRMLEVFGARPYKTYRIYERPVG